MIIEIFEIIRTILLLIPISQYTLFLFLERFGDKEIVEKIKHGEI